MNNKLKVEFPTQGWKQFLTARKEMLDAYDAARVKAKAHEVETYHGTVAEEKVREWLMKFLPQKYGVTSGYIVSPGLKETQKTPHFDVIIYDRLESPVLWVEESPKAQAIPVEYVYGVLEIKSAFSSKTVTDALDHLADLKPLMDGFDDPGERYKLHLPPNFFCGIIFFELRKEQQYSEAALHHLTKGMALRRFCGGLVLRGEGGGANASGRLGLYNSVTPSESMIGKDKASMLRFGMTEAEKLAENLYLGAMIKWTEIEFAQFAFDLIAMMQGKYEMGRLSSFYGFGFSQPGE